MAVNDLLSQLIRTQDALRDARKDYECAYFSHCLLTNNPDDSAQQRDKISRCRRRLDDADRECQRLIEVEAELERKLYPNGKGKPAVERFTGRLA